MGIYQELDVLVQNKADIKEAIEEMNPEVAPTGAMSQWPASIRSIRTVSSLSPYDSTPEMDGTGGAGSSNDYARGDHVHPTDTTRQAKITASGILKGNGSGGVSAAVSGTDYQAPLTFDDSPTSNSTNPVTSEGIRSALSDKVDKVDGKGLSSNDFTSAEKTKLSGIESGAQVNVQADWNATTAAAGAIKNKPTIPTQISPYTSTPEMDGTGAAGSSSNYAKGDHVHPTDNTRQAKITASGLLKGDGAGAISAAVAGTDYQTPISKSTTTPAMDGSGSAGTSTSYAAGDHVHPTDTTRQAKITASGLLKGNGSGTISAAVAGTDYQAPLSKSSTTPLMDGTGSAGTASTYAAGDHVHPTDTSRVAANAAITGATKCKITYDSKGLVTGGADLSGSDLPVATTSSFGAVKPDGTTITISSGVISAVGGGGSSISPSSSSPAMDGTASAGSSTSYARGDHVHPTDTSRQAALSAEQLEAVNSGITTDWVTGLDSEVSTLSENRYFLNNEFLVQQASDVYLIKNRIIYYFQYDYLNIMTFHIDGILQEAESSGCAIDFVLDCYVSSSGTGFSIELANLSDIYLRIPSGSNLADMLTIDSNSYVRLYFTQLGGTVSADKPVLAIHRLDLVEYDYSQGSVN